MTGELNLVGLIGSNGFTLLGGFGLGLDRLRRVESLRDGNVLLRLRDDEVLRVAASNNSTIRRAIKRTASTVVKRILVTKFYTEALCLS